MSNDHEYVQEDYSAPIYLAFDEAIEVFSFLTRHAHIDAMDRLDTIYRFEDLEDAFEKFQALVPDLRDNPKVEAAVRHHFREPLLETEAFWIRATLND